MHHPPLKAILNMQKSIVGHPLVSQKEAIVTSYHAVRAMLLQMKLDRIDRKYHKHFNKVYDMGPVMELREDMEDL